MKIIYSYKDYFIGIKDKLNYVVAKHSDGCDTVFPGGRTGVCYRNVRYYQHLTSAVRVIAKQVSDAEASTLNEWLTRYEQVVKHIEATFDVTLAYEADDDDDE